MRNSLVLSLLFLFAIGSTGLAHPPDSVEPLLNEDYYQVLRKEIDKAREEVIVSVFLFKTSKHPRGRTRQIQKALRQAAKRGVRVVVLLEKSNRDQINRTHEETARLLTDSGIQVLYDNPNKTMHTKVVVIDRSTVLIGSHNLTESALKHNYEASLLIRSGETASQLLRYLDSIHPEVYP